MLPLKRNKRDFQPMKNISTRENAFTKENVYHLKNIFNRKKLSTREIYLLEKKCPSRKSTFINIFPRKRLSHEERFIYLETIYQSKKNFSIKRDYPLRRIYLLKRNVSKFNRFSNRKEDFSEERCYPLEE